MKTQLRGMAVPGKLMFLVLVLYWESLVELKGKRADPNVEREARRKLVVLAIKAGTRETGQDKTVKTIYPKLFFGMRLQVNKIFVLKT